MNWTLNFNYWTSSTRQGSCMGNYSWCNSPGNVTLLGNQIWEAGSPDNKLGLEECLLLKIRTNGSGALLTDKNCTARFIFACQTVRYLQELIFMQNQMCVSLIIRLRMAQLQVSLQVATAPYAVENAQGMYCLTFGNSAEN